MTDSVILIILVFTFFIGWMKGFLRSLVGPLALIVCVYFSLDYFERTHRFGTAIMIGLFGPFVLSLAAGLLIRISSIGSKPGSTSRFAGGFLSVLWIGTILSFSLALIMIIPLPLTAFKTIQSDIQKSFTFAWVSPWIEEYLPEKEQRISDRRPQTRQEKMEAMQTTNQTLPLEEITLREESGIHLPVDRRTKSETKVGKVWK